MSNHRRERTVFNYAFPEEWYSTQNGIELQQGHTSPTIDRQCYDYYAYQATPRGYRSTDNQYISPQMLQISPSSSYGSSSGSQYLKQYNHENTGRYSNSSFGTSPPSPISINEDYYRAQGGKSMAYRPRESNSDARYITTNSNRSVYEVESYPSTQRRTTSSKRSECPYEDCVNSSGKRSSFSRPADLKRHVDSLHGDGKTYDCKMYRCDRKGTQGFSRKDHLVEHMRGYHKADIPKRVARG